MEVTVYDKDHIKDDLVGEATVDLAKYLNSSEEIKCRFH